MLGPSNRYVIRLSGPTVIGDCYGPGDDAADGVSGQLPTATAEPFERAAMILHGPECRPLAWRITTWHQPNPRILRLALSGVEVPLEAELWFEIDADTGLPGLR